MNVRLVDRKSQALTPSSLRCLSHLPTINMGLGCVHGCAYCYIRGYSQYPGDDAVVVYRNTAEQVECELARKRRKPIAVYFCPSSDAFMPVEAVLDQSYRTMQLLLERGVGVQFVTKGAIPERFIELFARRPELVAGQIGLNTVDDALNAIIEPRAAPARRRLNDLHRLVQAGVTASLRADPLIHGVTDGDEAVDSLFAAARACGVRDVSVSYLFLRPAIVASLKRSIADPELLRQILAPFDGARCSSIRGSESTGVSLPIEVRRREIDRLCRIAQRHELAVRLCGCKNPELTGGRCHLTNLTSTARAGASDSEPGLW